MRLTKVDQSNLARFGSAPLLDRNVLAIAWSPKSKQQAQSANIVTRLITLQTASGPLLSLAFEISSTKAMVQYCCFPINLSDKKETKYLAGILKIGNINLCFLAEDGETNRTFEIPSRQCGRMTVRYENAISDFRGFPINSYDFEAAVKAFEEYARLADYFQYLITESEFRRAITIAREQAASVSPEQRIQARRIADELLGLFLPKFGYLDSEILAKIPDIRRNFLFLLDLRQWFQGDADGFSRFLVDILSVRTAEEYQQLDTAVLLFKSIFRLMEDIKSDTATKENSVLQAHLKDVLASLVAGRGLSIKALINLVSGVGIPLGGQPGRHPSDYSREYAWKSGLSWTEVARKSLSENPDIRDEFRGRDFDSLTFQQQEGLKHRIREGVKSYAERLKKPFPIESSSKKAELQEID